MPYRQGHVHEFVLQRYKPPPFCEPVRYCECGRYAPTPFWLRVLIWIVFP